MKLIIDFATNGIVVNTQYEDKDEVSVFETEDGLGSEIYEGRAAVLWHIIDQLGWYGSKHDAKRIRVKIEETGDDNE